MADFHEAPWGGHGVFPNIYRDMRHPEKYRKSLWITYLFTVSDKPVKKSKVKKEERRKKKPSNFMSILVLPRLRNGRYRLGHVWWCSSRRSHSECVAVCGLSTSIVGLHHNFYCDNPNNQGSSKVRLARKSLFEITNKISVADLWWLPWKCSVGLSLILP